MDFATLIAPIAPAEFDARYWDREPLVIRGEGDGQRARILDWARLNAMLQIRPHWTAERFKLVLNSAPIDPAFYMEELNGRQVASPAQVDVLLGIGASLVAEMIEEVDAAVADLTAMLSHRFAAKVGANAYASFQGVQAFASHCDLHEVFAVQCAGAKRWRVYRNRADRPIEPLADPQAQARIDAAKGAVMLDVTLQPGDLIYIPRGYFHDAVATDVASLHLTIGVAPAWGTLLFNFLGDLARADGAFRHYLPDARDGDGAALRSALAALGERLSALAGSPAMNERVALWQRRFHRPVHRPALPARPAPTRLSRTRDHAEVSAGPAGSVVVTASGRSEPVGILSDVADYVLGRPAVLREEIHARFGHHPRHELDDLLDRLVRANLLLRQ